MQRRPLLALSLACAGCVRREPPITRVPERPQHADFRGVQPTKDAREVSDWIVAQNDHHEQPFVILDKRQAHVYVFDGQARLLGDTPVLLGSAPGDDSVPGIGLRPIAQVRPQERTTPAGRFEAKHGRNAQGEDVIWVDYNAAVSMHRVRATVASERRLQRLASPTIADNRISYGCINVPVKFFENVLLPAFRGPRLTVYVLPETRPWQRMLMPGATTAAWPGQAGRPAARMDAAAAARER